MPWTAPPAAPAPAPGWPRCTPAVNWPSARSSPTAASSAASSSAELTGRRTIGPYAVVLPTITGSGWVTGRSRWVLDETDPFPTGYTVGDIWAPQLYAHESTPPDHITKPPDLDTRRPTP